MKFMFIEFHAVSKHHQPGRLKSILDLMLPIVQCSVSPFHQRKKLELEMGSCIHTQYLLSAFSWPWHWNTCPCPRRASILGGKHQLSNYKELMDDGRDGSHQGQVRLLWKHLTEGAGSVWVSRRLGKIEAETGGDPWEGGKPTFPICGDSLVQRSMVLQKKRQLSRQWSWEWELGTDTGDVSEMNTGL